MKSLLTLLFSIFTVFTFAQGPGDKAAITQAVKTYTVQSIKAKTSMTDFSRKKFTVKVGKIKDNRVQASIRDEVTIIYDTVILERNGASWKVVRAEMTSE